MSAASNEKMKQTRASSSEQKQEEEEREGGLTFNPIWFWSAVSEWRHGQHSNCNDGVSLRESERMNGWSQEPASKREKEEKEEKGER